MDCSPPGSSVHGILHTRILEWFAVLFSRGSSQPRDWTQVFHIAGKFFTVWATRALVCIYGSRASLLAQMVKNLPTMQNTWVQSLGWEDPMGKRMATHSSIVTWRIPMDRGAWQGIVHGSYKESDTIECLYWAQYKAQQSFHSVYINQNLKF